MAGSYPSRLLMLFAAGWNTRLESSSRNANTPEMLFSNCGRLS